MAHLNPYEILTVTLLFVVLPGVVFGTVIVRFVRTALDLKHLVELGPGGRIETEAIVLEKDHRFDKIRRGTHRYHLRYEYRDGFGAVHRRRAEVPKSLWAESVVNGPVLIAYSPRRPGVSAPLPVLAEAATRFGRLRREGGSEGTPDS